MKRHDDEYTALIHELAHRYAVVLDLVMTTDEDLTSYEDKMRADLRAAGLVGKEVELALCDMHLVMLQALKPRH
jgi:hypothetical protein